MTRIRVRNWLFGLLALALAGLFFRLGVWQLHRLGERRARNVATRERLALPPLRLRESSGPDGLPAADSVDGRRIRVRGRFEYSSEILLRGRSFEGAPGVYVVTPLRLTHTRSAILVLRGWMPAADGLHADLETGRPARDSWGDLVTVEGIARAGSRKGPIPPQRVEIGGEAHTALSTLSLSDVAAAVPYPVAAFYVRANRREAPLGTSAKNEMPSEGWTSGKSRTTDGGKASSKNVRSAGNAGLAASVRAGRSRLPIVLPPPLLDNGPHLSYAIQWFAFALISLVGTAAYLRRSTGSPPA